MKSFKDVVIVKQPVDVIWARVRDRMPELGAMLDDIECIAVIERAPTTSGWHLVNEWHASQRIPGMLQAQLGGAKVSWLDRNEWDEAAKVCRWTIEPSVLKGQIQCAGETRYEPAMGGRGTRVTFSGTFDLANGALAGMAGALERPIAAFVESVVTILVPRNLRKVMEAAAKLAPAA